MLYEVITLFFFVHSVGKRSGGRLVDDALHIEPGDLAGILGRLALRVVEVGGDRDHRLGRITSYNVCYTKLLRW